MSKRNYITRFLNPDDFDGCGHCGDAVYTRHGYKTDSDQYICHHCIHWAGECQICSAFEMLEKTTDGTLMCTGCINAEMNQASDEWRVA